MLAVLGAAAFLIVNEGARKALLDRIFGAEEEFEYTSTTLAVGCTSTRMMRTRAPTGALGAFGNAPPYRLSPAMAHSVEVLLPAQRYVFALDEHGNAEPQPASHVGGGLPHL